MLAHRIRLDTNIVDYAILALYFVAVLGIGFAAKRYIKTSLDYFLSGRSLPAWITGLAFISANLGALEILGMAANGAQFGVYTVHYYWIGAVPAMVFLGIVMMPFYYGSKVRSVPEYLRLRFNKPTHLLQRADLRVRHRADRRREPLRAGARAQADARLADPARHRRRRGHRARLHHARRPLVGDLQRGAAVLRDPRRADPARRSSACTTSAAGTASRRRVTEVNSERRAVLHAWEGTGIGNVDNPLGASWVPIVFGLGFVLSFGYWTTNFAEVQRALIAKSLSAAQRTPLIGAYPKVFIPCHHDDPRPRRAGRRSRASAAEDAEPGVQQRDPAADERVPAQRHARARARGPAGGVHGGRRGQRVGVQHGRHLRPLGAVRPLGRERRLLPAIRPHRDGHRHRRSASGPP